MQAFQLEGRPAPSRTSSDSLGLIRLPQFSPIAPDASFRAATRGVRAALGASVHIQDALATLEQLQRRDEPPRTARVRPLESGAFAGRAIRGRPEPGFVAFLDGVQQSRVVAYVDGAPIVHGTAAAAVRERRDRRMHTWHSRVEHRLYAPRQHLPPGVWENLAPLAPFDSSAPEGDEPATSRHPLSTLERAVHLVQGHREELEQRLAERWCDQESRPLFVDGGISGSERVARNSCVVGVVKSHRTLYAVDEALSVVLRLGPGERTTVFLLEPKRRTAVASWYLRLRDATGHDPTFGLIRVEIARDPNEHVSTRADEVSRWLLAEGAPLALPDSRWDRMAYGIRDSEEFLKAIT
jgi:hypothetical protein